ncbi:hypothetical protein I204_01978 [Kwoniella mangroviensis CBS 8886]|uniref:uncharacterized protein n=1 Tax=Kwoniella mangroviensis CBS 8507 TaxID=1296122 RepID=UPI00080D381C|nr:uncharacterized protein I203_03716 [Kwoniella mangroviensis CBS 8507]OCF67033.1 hypothetical protein I203_03716 [Kwoniella mangroviensis CBS 8507]OCF77973.1 hypothetical protein I204_01978 [Kwoniella mangroviensis CBS 8886]
MALKDKWDERKHEKHHKRSGYFREYEDPRSPKTARSPAYDGYLTPSSSEGRYTDDSTNPRNSREVVVSSSSDRSGYSGYSDSSSGSSDDSISAPQMRRTRGRRAYSSDAFSYPESVTSSSEGEEISSVSRSSKSISTGSPISPRQPYPVYEGSPHSSVSSPSNIRGTQSSSEEMTGYSDEPSPISKYLVRKPVNWAGVTCSVELIEGILLTDGLSSTIVARSDRIHVRPKGRHDESEYSGNTGHSPTYGNRARFMGMIGKGLDKVAQTVGGRR